MCEGNCKRGREREEEGGKERERGKWKWKKQVHKGRAVVNANTHTHTSAIARAECAWKAGGEPESKASSYDTEDGFSLFNTSWHQMYCLSYQAHVKLDRFGSGRGNFCAWPTLKSKFVSQGLCKNIESNQNDVQHEPDTKFDACAHGTLKIRRPKCVRQSNLFEKYRIIFSNNI